MYNDNAGAMYEYEEEKKKKELRRKKLLIRRITVVSILLVFVIYFSILLIDIGRYKNGQSPLITLSTVKKEYDDGYVLSQNSIGWVFREYNRETIRDFEMVPFWSEIRMDHILNRINEGDLPEIETGYDIPTNNLKYDKVDDVLFFYDTNEEQTLLDTYKCILSETDCEIAKSAVYENDESQMAKKMGIIEKRYVFIREYRNKKTEAEEQFVYLYDINAKRIIAKYEDVRYSLLQDDIGYIDSSKYIVKKNGKYGIDQVIKGKVTNVEDYLHTTISFDEKSKQYIFQDENEYYGYDANTKTYTNKVSEYIDNIKVVNDKTYLIVKHLIKSYDVYSGFYYNVYNSDGNKVIAEEDIVYMNLYDKFIIYVVGNKVNIVNYDGQSLIKEEINTFFNEYSSLAKVKSLNVTLNGNTLIISTPKSRDYSHYTAEYYYNIDTFELTNFRANVKENVE